MKDKLITFLNALIIIAFIGLLVYINIIEPVKAGINRYGILGFISLGGVIAFTIILLFRDYRP